MFMATLSSVTKDSGTGLLWVLFCAAMTMALVTPAHAQWRDPAEQFGPELRRFTDPLDGSVFESRSLLSTNGLGGYDSDGCTYAKGQQPRTFAVATSPSTGFSARIADFPAALSAAQKEKVRAVLAEFGVTLPEGQKVRVWDSTAEVRYLVVPQRPAGTEGLSEDELAALVTRDSMIGTALAQEPGA